MFFFLTIGSAAQSDVHQNAADIFIKDFNNGDYEHIYQSLSPRMQQARGRTYYIRFFENVRKDIGKLHFLELYDYRGKAGNERGIYNGHFESEMVTVRITTNQRGRIIGVYIKKKPLL